MDFGIDNYCISLSFGGSMIISIGGQNIIFDRYDPVLNSFEGAYIFAIDAIKKLQRVPRFSVGRGEKT